MFSQRKILFALAAVPIIYLIAYFKTPKPAPPFEFIPPDPEEDYKAPVGWKGVRKDQKERFLNEQYPFYQNYVQILKWIPSHAINLLRNRRKFFDISPEKHNDKTFLEKANTLIWLGHASFFLNLNGVKILIDPHFYHTSIYKRHTPAPIKPTLFTSIDYILLSHNHEDHCNKKSLVQLFEQNPEVTILAGLNMDTLLQSFTKQKLTIITADWYRKYRLDKPLEIFFTPSRHYCNRIGDLYNGCLWGGFVIKYNLGLADARTLYFEGDSGASNHFADIKTLFAPDIAIIGIGAFKPEWFMHPNHMSPKSALNAFDACGAKTMIPMHYGTFNLSNEDMEAPLEELKANAETNKIEILFPGEKMDTPLNVFFAHTKNRVIKELLPGETMAV